jgi:hypothetical protein
VNFSDALGKNKALLLWLFWQLLALLSLNPP